MSEHSQWQGHRLNVLPQGTSWLTIPIQTPAPERAAAVPEPSPVSPPPAKNRSWFSTALLAVLGTAALITIFVARGSGQIHEPTPLPEAPSKVITTLARDQRTVVRVQVGQYLRLTRTAGRSYSTVVEQASTDKPPIEDLDLPGQDPLLRADSPGHATVEVLSEPSCSYPQTCPDRRALAGTLDVTVTP